MSVSLFPGQGSQVKGMGEDLFNRFSELTAKADDILGYSVKTLCLEDSHHQLHQTQYTQPALYTVNALTYFKKLQDTGKKPTFVAGHSLGEYNALLAAGVFDFATGLKLVSKRGELMSHATGGAMTAIVGLKIDQIKAILLQNNLNQVCIANHNSHTQIVISGLKPEIEQATKLFEQAGAMLVVPLKVSGAFHSSHMQHAQQEFANYIKDFQLQAPQIPVIANTTAKPYAADDIKKNLAQQITNSVRWTESIDFLLAQDETEFEEVGPGVVLTGLVRRIKNGQ